ncbi:helix-turn-helix transcriptional regulator [Mesorhizobium xinjiangense]|uniref:helix-turn-helix transcriptional regulator n=1 Tax=Mesorhizobium xinjiangense TaxID=2678685 RepID=UPI0018DC0AE5|nr:hypothetical protein [Mesorhizobium xinjiangense]
MSDPARHLSRPVPRVGLNRMEVALSLGVSPNTVDAMVADGSLPHPRLWNRRKIWLLSEIEAAMMEWPTEAERKGADLSGWRASA